MAEVKNTFIQSKMNQDLDGRILPNGQYRYGKNIQISRSEGDDVGALENVLGTELLTSFGLVDPSYEIIGHVVDVPNDLVYVFITNYSDSSNNQLDNNITGQNNALGVDNKNCFIGVYNNKSGSGKILVGGDFLNFSKSHIITGVNLIEDLLFWTDNRNQPRKINVNTAAGTPYELTGVAGYYNTEDHISVAKYYPFECISLLKSASGSEQWTSSMTNKTEQWLPPYCIAEVETSTVGYQSYIDLKGEYNNIKIGGTNPRISISGVNIIDNPTTAEVTSVNVGVPGAGETRIFITPQQNIDAEDLVYFSAENPDYDTSWPGDETFLSDKFVRFSYRFQFDDGEYSLMAPFTQACFVPKQDGYFIGGGVENLTPPMNTADAISDTGDGTAPEIPWDVSSTLIGDEGKAYGSSIVDFFENKIQDIGLYIPAPYKNSTQSTFDNIQDEFKIQNIEIIYKESNNANAYVLDTIAADEGIKPFNLETTSLYSYDYQSRKPWKVLAEREIVRVYDKVPIRALAQESSGNRVIYGNYIDKHTSPDSLTYVVGIDPKPDIPKTIHDTGFGDKDYYIQKEYQNHTVKQNRTYQVGVVLSDRYGRQSDVILSDIFNDVIQGRGSTIYHPYRTTQSTLIEDATSSSGADTWPGDQINMIWHQIIPETLSKEGYPGIYKNNNGTFTGFARGGTSSGWANPAWVVPGDTCCWPKLDILGINGSTATITFCADHNGEIINSTIVVIDSSNDWQEGETIVAFYDDSIFPTCSFGALGGWDLKATTLVDQNTLGWYSWKVVVKQTEQDYYNCYLPGMLAGYPKDIRSNTPTTSPDTSAIIFPKGDESKTGHIVLINDNINKIPRDLSEVGPTQNVFGSSVKLFGRVENYKTPSTFYTYNRQFDPETLPDTVINVGNLTDLNLGKKDQAGTYNLAAAPFSYPSSKSILIPINFYNGISNPIVAEVSTKKEIGWSANDSGGQDISLGMIPYLSIYETEPVTSDLDIYWETSTGGLISELNHNIGTIDNTVPCDITDVSIDWSESDAPGDYISDTFKAVSCTGVELDSPSQETTVQLLSVKNDLGHEKVHEFVMEKTVGYNEYRLKLTTTLYEGYFLAWNDNSRRTWTFTFQIDRPGVPNITLPYSAQTTRTVQVQNATPNQIGMFDLPPYGSNNARTDLKVSVWRDTGQYGTMNTICGGGVASDATSAIIGDWQLDGGGYAGDPDNHYWETFGYNWNTSSIFSSNNDGTQDYAPTFGPVFGGFGFDISYQGHTVNINKFLDRKITMVNNPDYSWRPVWIGDFQAFNGAYGTTYGAVAPHNPNKGSELVYSIARAYQVSAFFPYQTDAVHDFSNPSKGQYSIGEAVFHNGGGSNAPVFSLLPKSPSWGGWIGNQNVPTGPIYRDFAQGNITDPADISTGGEAIVGQLYNIAETGHNHYWEGLELCMPVNSNMKYLQTPGPGVSEMPNSPNKAGFWYVNAVEIGGDDPQFGGSSLKLGLAQACGINNGHVPNFVIKQSSPPNAYEPQEAYLMTDPHVPIPPGRYVVTVRVTDRSTTGASGDGLYFEWDVPVIINGPFIKDTGSFWVLDGGSGDYANYNSSLVNTYPWKDLPL